MKEQLEQIIAFAKERLQDDRTGHDFAHAQRVARLAESILKDEDKIFCDKTIILTSAYLHDTIDDKVVPDPEKALQEVEDFLHSLGLQEKQIQEILYIITHLSFSQEIEHGKADLSLEGQIVQDADRLDALGAIGVLRTAYFGGAHGDVMYDETVEPVTYTSKKDYRKGSTVVNHFYEKLFVLADGMNTEFGRKEALRRKEFMESFLEEFYQEWHGK
ncbi:HD domain-containing protein [Enterococcus mediterraneensis]|uniref:HD domain-containing protein n=1 Tax=Enterococcus mediterraneensis TaxID=2364791 RepID=UPI000F06420F|nr:HD domain-containing protein [Enterococcus mediterraneensis]